MKDLLGFFDLNGRYRRLGKSKDLQKQAFTGRELQGVFFISLKKTEALEWS